MSRVAETIRRVTTAETSALAVEERILLALRLGDSDAEILAGARGTDVASARRLLRSQRQAGRRPSRCAAE